MKLKALLMVYLILMIPFATTVFADEAQMKYYCSESAHALDQQISEDEEDNEMLDQIVAIAYLVCTVMNAINTVISTLDAFTGGAACCKLPVITQTVCAATTSLYQTIGPIDWGNAKFICGYVNNGWCGLATQWVGLEADEDLANYVQLANSAISSYDSIQVAQACYNIVAIRYHQRNLNKIKKEQVCCIENSCEGGYSTETCDYAAAVAECVYVEGGMKNTLMKSLIALVSVGIAMIVPTSYTRGALWDCVGAVMNLVSLPNILSSVEMGMDWVSNPVNEMSCSEFTEGVEGVIDELNEDYSPGSIDPESFAGTEETWKITTPIDGIQEGGYKYYTDGTYYISVDSSNEIQEIKIKNNDQFGTLPSTNSNGEPIEENQEEIAKIKKSFDSTMALSKQQAITYFQSYYTQSNSEIIQSFDESLSFSYGDYDSSSGTSDILDNNGNVIGFIDTTKRLVGGHTPKIVYEYGEAILYDDNAHSINFEKYQNIQNLLKNGDTFMSVDVTGLIAASENGYINKEGKYIAYGNDRESKEIQSAVEKKMAEEGQKIKDKHDTAIEYKGQGAQALAIFGFLSGLYSMFFAKSIQEDVQEECEERYQSSYTDNAKDSSTSMAASATTATCSVISDTQFYVNIEASTALNYKIYIAGTSKSDYILEGSLVAGGTLTGNQDCDCAIDGSPCDLCDSIQNPSAYCKVTIS